MAGPGSTRPSRHLGRRHSELGRWGLTGQHVTVVALCLLLLILLVAWWALRSVPQTDQVSLASNGQPTGASVTPDATETAADSTVGGAVAEGTAALAAPGAPAPPEVAGVAAATTSSGPGRLVVDVAGRVRHPGIVELPPVARVVDAIAAAGGALRGVSLTALNLARPLTDGEQILVGIRVHGPLGAPPAGSGGAAGGLGTTAPAIQPVELNSATLEQLDTLPGIGPVTAQAIVQWRTDNGPFTSVDDLLEVSGIGDVTLGDIRDLVYV